MLQLENDRFIDIPPRTMTAGNSTFDDMGHLRAQMLTRTKEDLGSLKLAIWRHKVGKSPTDVAFQYNLGVVWNEHGKTREAAEAFQQAVRIDPKYARGATAILRARFEND